MNVTLAGPETEFVAAPGLRLAVYDMGGAGLPVVFQHGLCGDAGQTAEAFPEDPRFRLLTLECRGHGRSDAGDPAAFSLAAFAGDVAAFIESRRLGPAVIGGISMGAALALRLAVRRPDLVRGLVLARPAWLTEAAPENMAPYAEVGGLLQRLPADEARAAFVLSETARRLASEAPDNLSSLLGFFDRKPQHVTAALLCSIAAAGPGVAADELRALKVPTCVVGHERDRAHPLAHAEALAGLIAGARLVRITPKADDRARYVREFRAALGDFLQTLI